MKYIYADFNSMSESINDPEFVCIELTGYGTMLSLNRLRIRLKEGDRYIFFEHGDIEGEGVVFFDRNVPSRFSNEGSWFAKIKRAEIKESKKDFDYKGFPCYTCGRDMTPIFNETGRHYNEICPDCNTLITYALSTPS